MISTRMLALVFVSTLALLTQTRLIVAVSYDKDHIVQMEAVVSRNGDQLKAKGKSLGVIETAKTKLQFINKYKDVYDGIFGDGDGCYSEPSEGMKAEYLPINVKVLPAFLKSAFVTSLPRVMQNQLQFLTVSDADASKPVSLTETFSRMLDRKLNKDEKEGFEIGFVHLQAYLDEPSETWHILILSAYVTSSVSNNCHFKQHFREKFVGLGEDVGYWLAIKAALNAEFVKTLTDFNPDRTILGRLGFRPMNIGGFDVFSSNFGTTATLLDGK